MVYMIVCLNSTLIRTYRRLVESGGPGELHMTRQAGCLLEHATRVSLSANPKFQLEDWVKTRFVIWDNNKDAANAMNLTMNPELTTPGCGEEGGGGGGRDINT